MARAVQATSSIDPELAKWKLAVEHAEKDRRKWLDRCDKIIERYRDDRQSRQEKRRKMNIFWSNVQTLRASLYGRQPIPVCERRFLDRDPVGRVASQILERALRYSMEPSGFHRTMQREVDDYLLVGRGVPWVRYDPLFGPDTSLTETGEEQGAEGGSEYEVGESASEERAEGETPEQEQVEQAEVVVSEDVRVDYINWKDFLTGKARTWEEVPWIAKRVYLSREELCDRYGKKIGKEIPLKHGPNDDEAKRTGTDQASEELRKAEIWEIWSKPDRKVYRYAVGYDKWPEAAEDDPLRLTEFFPVPEPLLATTTNDSLIPVPDYTEYQDQAQEIDELTRRIDRLTAACKVAGVYNAANKALARMLDEGVENELIPVNDWASLMDKGGLEKAISLLPIEQIANVLLNLIQAREQAKKDLYEITGIADIIRGNSDPNETAKAQQIKGRFATVRLSNRQQQVAHHCRDVVAIMGEIIAEHFSPETLITVSGVAFDEGIGRPVPPPPQIQMPQPPQLPPGTPPDAAQQAMQQYQIQAQIAQQQMMAWQQQKAQIEQEKQQLVQSAIELLRRDKMRGFRIDIETDSTLATDDGEEKTDRIEFVQSASVFLKQSMEAVAVYPQIAPLLGRMMLFAIRGFRTGRDLESAFEDFIDSAEKNARGGSLGQQPGKQAEQAKAQAQVQTEQIKAQSAAAAARAEITKAALEAQSEQANEKARQETKAMEAAMAQQKHQVELLKLQQEQEYAEASHRQRMAELMTKHALDAAKAARQPSGAM